MAKDHQYYYSSSSSSGHESHVHHHQPLPLHLCCFLGVLLMFIAFSWYINYEPVLESMFDQLKLVVMVSPLLLLLAVHLLSSDMGRQFSSLIPLPEKDSLHRAGGTPWGVASLLVFFFFMISYQSHFHERWFPLLSRWSMVSLNLSCVITNCHGKASRLFLIF